MRTRARALLATTLALCAGACAAPAEVGVVEPTQARPARPAWRSGQSAAGGWRVRWRSEPSPIPINDPFRLLVEVEDVLRPSASLREVSLAVDAGMPAHGHGMNRVPRVRRLADGRFEAEGLLFHMPGTWELYLDVARAGIAERAQFRVEVD